MIKKQEKNQATPEKEKAKKERTKIIYKVPKLEKIEGLGVASGVCANGSIPI